MTARIPPWAGYVLLGLLASGTALAAEMTVPDLGNRPSAGQVWTFLFLLLGPIKIIAPFASLTRTASPALARGLAWRASLYALAVLGVAALTGVRMLENYRISPAVLELAGALVVFLVALRGLLDQIAGVTPRPGANAPVAGYHLAFSPLAFPVIVTPAGVAAVIVFMDLAPDITAKLLIIGLMLLIMALNLLAMLFASVLLQWAEMPLQVFGAVLGVIQLALGLHIILFALNTLNVIVYHGG